MKNLFYGFASALLLISCSVDKIEKVDATQHLTYQNALEADTFGFYKGVFTTNNSEYRGSLEINIPFSDDMNNTVKRNPTAELITSNGDVYYANAFQTVERGSNSVNLEFQSQNLSFTMSIAGRDLTPVISNFIFLNEAGSIMAAKHTSRAPVTPISGAYEVTIDQGHPVLNNAGVQTFNLMFTGTPTGNTNVTTQVVLGGNTYNSGIGVQNSCAPFNNFTTCNIVSGDGMSTTGFTVDGKAVAWEGIHRFNNQATGPNDCSGVIGTWTFESAYGLVSGIFESDNPCFKKLYRRRFQQFRGQGFQPVFEAGKLSSDIIKVNGLSDGPMAFGDTKLTGDFARGESDGNVGTGGVYSFHTGNGNYALGVQPGATDFTPGDFEFKIVNSTGAAVNTFYISYRIYVNNNENRSNSLKFSHSVNGTTYTAEPSLDFTSIAASDVIGWKKIKRSININASVPAGGFIYLKFTGDDVGGSGARDEFAIDNILVQAN